MIGDQLVEDELKEENKSGEMSLTEETYRKNMKNSFKLGEWKRKLNAIIEAREEAFAQGKYPTLAEGVAHAIELKEEAD